MNKKVFIVLATFNGERFVKEQIESIVSQTWGDWILLIRDDGSTDETVSVVESLSRDDPRVIVLDQAGEKINKGTVSNFESLVKSAVEMGANYIMFADQDDVWNPKKIEILMDKMLGLEERGGELSPILIHSDLEVVNEELGAIAPSFLSYQKISHKKNLPLSVLLPQNFITGCTVLFNRELACLALPMPSDAIMHDWWIGLLAGAAGHVAFIDKATVRYRQHSNNQVGAKSFFQMLCSPNRIIGHIKKGDVNFIKSIKQAQQLAWRLQERGLSITPENDALIKYYTRLQVSGKHRRLINAVRYQVGPQNFLRKILFYYRLIKMEGHNLNNV